MRRIAFPRSSYLPDLTNPAEDTDTIKLIGNSTSIRQVRSMIEKLSRSQVPVYISGESGSGKELAARLIHQNGSRRDGPFIAVNCGAFPENIMESEFFGHKKGSFTGATQDKEGMFHPAKNGMLFLDEVADLPFAIQIKLLRAIQKKVLMVGGTQEKSVDVLIISGTSVLMEHGEFRHDLYFHLNVIELELPALHEMLEDIPLLVNALLAKRCREEGRHMPAPSPEASQMLARHSFQGNVRKLKNMLEHTLAFCDGSSITANELLLTSTPASLHPIPGKPWSTKPCRCLTTWST